MQKIKVLRIIARLNIGGPAIHAILLTEGLPKDKFDSLLICGSLSQDEGDMLYYARQKNVKPIFLKALTREIGIIQDIKAFRELLNIIYREKPDIIHTHTAKAGTLGRLAGILYKFANPFKPKKIALIHTFHGHVFFGYFGHLKSYFFILIERLLALFTDKIVTVSKLLKEDLLHYRICRENKITVIHLGFDLDKFKGLPALNDRPLRSFGIVGRLVPIKNHRLLFEAVKLFLDRNPKSDVTFKIIGDGELKNELLNLSKNLGLTDRIKFSGWMNDPLAIYSQLDAVILTSLNEGTPVSIIEAMSCSRPVIATDVGGVSDLLGESKQVINGFNLRERGITVGSQDAHALAEAISFLIDNKQIRNQFVDSALKYALSQFTRDRLLQDIEALYLHAAAK